MSQKMAKMAMLSKNKEKIFIYDENQCQIIDDENEHKKVGDKCLQKMANFVCQICHYYTHKKYNYEIHLSSIKHIENVASVNIISNMNTNVMFVIIIQIKNIIMKNI